MGAILGARPIDQCCTSAHRHGSPGRRYDLPLDLAVFAEPLACAVHGMDVLGLRPGADVLMMGAGTTGLLLAKLLLHGGAGRLTVAAPTEFKLELARAYGADRVVQITRDSDATARTLPELQPDGYDVAIDVTGAASVVQHLPDQVGDNGTILVYGMCDQDKRVASSRMRSSAGSSR